MAKSALSRFLVWLWSYWPSVGLAILVAAWVVILLFALWPDVSHEWHQFLNRRVTVM